MAYDPEQDSSLNQNRQLHICPQCYSELVQPTRWEQSAKRGFWRVWLRCPECEHREDGTFPDNIVDALDDVLDDGREELSRSLRDMEMDSMKEAANIFAIALQADLINADDFLPQRK